MILYCSVHSVHSALIAKHSRVELKYLHSLTRESTEFEENQRLRNQITSSKTLQSLFMKFLNIMTFPFFYCYVDTVHNTVKPDCWSFSQKKTFSYRPETIVRLLVLRGPGFAGW